MISKLFHRWGDRFVHLCFHHEVCSCLHELFLQYSTCKQCAHAAFIYLLNCILEIKPVLRVPQTAINITVALVLHVDMQTVAARWCENMDT